MRDHPALTPFFLSCLLAVSLITLGPACAGDLQDRRPAVAGQFYPADPEELRAMVRTMLAHARPSGPGRDPLALIVPHAGYVFSGEVAAHGFAALDTERPYKTIFVLGPSHRVAFEGAAVYVAGDFLTPLGKVAVDRSTGRELLRKDGVFTDRTDAHALEHCLEVQIPFLQVGLTRPFAIVPIVIGAQRPETCRRIAAGLAPYLKQGNLFVISTDLSHYPAYDDAVRADRSVTDAITTGSPEAFMRAVQNVESAGTPGLETALCGLSGVLTLLEMTSRDENLALELIAYRNSGDVALYGNKRQVVGYAALQVYRKEEKGFDLGAIEKARLLSIARATVESCARGKEAPPVEPSSLPAALRVPAGAFVTLHCRGELRGCIGRFDAAEPLYGAVRSMAVAAATQDPRFTPVRPGELADITIEISVLTPMKKITSPEEFEPGKHGIYIRKGDHAGTFLPQVARETGWNRAELLGHCSRDKAGLGWEGWKEAELYVYEALVFGESGH